MVYTAKPTYTLITPPANSPVSVDELKQWLNITHSHQDGKLQMLIDQATAMVEQRTGRQLMKATWEYRAQNVPSTLLLFKPPYNALVSCKYIDADGNEQTLTENTDFKVVPDIPTVVTFKNSHVTNEVYNAFQYQFKAGVTSVNDLPQPLRTAILFLASRMYSNPDDPPSSLTTFSDNLISDYKVYQWQAE